MDLKNMLHEKMSQEFRLKSLNKTRNYLIEKIKQNENPKKIAWF